MRRKSTCSAPRESPGTGQSRSARRHGRQTLWQLTRRPRDPGRVKALALVPGHCRTGSIDPASSLHSDHVPTVGPARAEQRRKGGVRCRTTWPSGTGARITNSAVGGMVTGSGPWRGSRGTRWSSGRRPPRDGPRRGPLRFTAIQHPAGIVPLGRPVAPAATPGRSTSAAGLLGAGVACGIAGLFPAYLSGASLASVPANLVPHVIYLATWLASALLDPARGNLAAGGCAARAGYQHCHVRLLLRRSRHGDVRRRRPLSRGLAVGLIGWLLCTTGAALAAWPPGLAGAPRWNRPAAVRRLSRWRLPRCWRSARPSRSPRRGTATPCGHPRS